MKKTFKLGCGRRPQDNFNFFSIFLLVRLKSSCKQKISQLACLIMRIAMKKTLYWDLEDDLKIFLIYFSIFVLVSLSMPKISFLGPMEVVQILFDGPIILTSDRQSFVRVSIIWGLISNFNLLCIVFI